MKRPLLMLKKEYYDGIADGSKPVELRNANTWGYLLREWRGGVVAHVMPQSGPRRHLRIVEKVVMENAEISLGREPSEAERKMFGPDPVVAIYLGDAPCPACFLDGHVAGYALIEQYGGRPPCDAGLCLSHHRDDEHRCRRNR